MSDIAPSTSQPAVKVKIGGTDREQSRKDATMVLNTLFEGKKVKLHDDFASIIAFLATTGHFEEVFLKVDADVRAAMEKTANRQKNEEGGSNRLTTAFFDLFTAYGATFPRVQNVVLVGSSASVFGTIVSHGIHFKDATGPGHGEYSHTVQWLVIARAVSDKQLTLEKTVAEIYRESAGGLQALGKGKLIGQNAEPQVYAYWNLLVDCFRADDLNLEESALENLVSSTYRSPGYLTLSLRGGPLKQTFLAQHLGARYARRTPKETSKLTAEKLREYQKLKQGTKPGRLGDLGEGVNVILPDNAPPDFVEALRQRKGVDLKPYKTG